MVEIAANDLAKIIRDLLRIAKVAMPDDLYWRDPRVLAAAAALRGLEAGVSPDRPPNVASRFATIDPARLSQKTAVELSTRGVAFVVTLPWEVVGGLIAEADDLLPFDIADAAPAALRAWLSDRNARPERISD